MDITSALTVSNLTPPGYFDLSESAPAEHRAFIEWWNNILELRSADAVALKTLILTPWLVDHQDSPRTPWLQYLLHQYGYSHFGGINNQAAYLFRLISSAWSTSSVYNFKLVLQAFSLPPFSWFVGDSPEIYIGNLVTSISDTGFLIYSTASSPATPSPSAYTPRAWNAPTDWTKGASSAVSYSRGYLSGANIVWCAPRAITDFNNNYVFSASVPLVVASAGTVCIVDDDGTGDRSVCYYSDGSAWRKNSLTNVDLGLVNPTGARPNPESITVWAPDPSTVPYSVDSNTPPPEDGRSEGHGTFASWSDTTIFNNQLTLSVNQISGGYLAIATLISLLRRIKPANINLLLYISNDAYIIKDVRQK